MPQSNNYLRKKFMIYETNGIIKAEKIIKNNGGKIENYIIIIPNKKLDSDIADAIEFLVQEWDYGLNIEEVK